MLIARGAFGLFDEPRREFITKTRIYVWASGTRRSSGLVSLSKETGAFVSTSSKRMQTTTINNSKALRFLAAPLKNSFGPAAILNTMSTMNTPRITHVITVYNMVASKDGWSNDMHVRGVIYVLTKSRSHFHHTCSLSTELLPSKIFFIELLKVVIEQQEVRLSSRVIAS